MGNPELQDAERTSAKPRFTTLRWVLFLPVGLFSGLIAAKFVYSFNYVFLQRVLPVPPFGFFYRLFFECFVPLTDCLAFGGIAIATAAKVAPSHRKEVGKCLGGVIIFLAVALFTTNTLSDNYPVLYRSAETIGFIVGSCLGVAYAFRLSKKDLKPPDQ